MRIPDIKLLTPSDVILSEVEGSRRSRIYLKIERAALLLPRHSERKGHCPNRAMTFARGIPDMERGIILYFILKV